MKYTEFLRGIAQNDYMIDQNMLDDGRRLLEVADYVEQLQSRFLQCRKQRGKLNSQIDRLRWCLDEYARREFESRKECERLRALLASNGQDAGYGGLDANGGE